MSVRVLSALDHRVEASIVTQLEAAGPEVTLVRRCPDLADLLAAAASGLADVALVSGSLRGLDGESVARLHGDDVRIVGLSVDEDQARALVGIGIDRVRSESGELADLLSDLREAELLAPSSPSVSDILRRDSLGGATAAGPDTHVDISVDHDPRPRPPATVIAVWGPAGAPGRTTVAVNLAAELAAEGKQALLIDADTWGASVAQSLALVDEAPGLVAAVRAADQGRLDEMELARLAPSVAAHWRVLTGLPRPDRWPEIRPAALERVLGLAGNIAEVLVIDCAASLEDDEELSYDTAAPRRNAATLTALASSTALVAVGSADPVGLQRLVRGVQDLATLSSPAPWVVVNKLRDSAIGRHPDRQIRQTLGRFAGLEDLEFLPWDLPACDAAMLAGEPLRAVAARSPLRTAIRDLSMRVLAASAQTPAGQV
ncbi:MAG: CpaE family protein [Nostocoides sp.]